MARARCFCGCGARATGLCTTRGAEGFADWLDFLLRPRHASLLSNDYPPETARQIGFMSWRFLRLACPGFDQAMPGLTTQDAVEAFVKQHSILGVVLRQENLRDDLKKLVSTQLASCIPRQAEALQWLLNSPPVNVSVADAGEAPLEPALLKRVLAREWVIYRQFYPDAMAAMLRDIGHEKRIEEGLHASG